jgi:hypothetical protein
VRHLLPAPESLEHPVGNTVFSDERRKMVGEEIPYPHVGDRVAADAERLLKRPVQPHNSGILIQDDDGFVQFIKATVHSGPPSCQRCAGTRNAGAAYINSTLMVIDIILFKISVSTVIRGARGKILDNSALPIWAVP